MADRKTKHRNTLIITSRQKDRQKKSKLHIKLQAILSFFQVLNHDLVIYIDFTHVAASNTATDDVTN